MTPRWQPRSALPAPSGGVLRGRVDQHGPAPFSGQLRLQDSMRLGAVVIILEFDADPATRTITYKLQDGTVWTDGGAQ